MKIVDLVDGQVVITPEALCISPFSELWQEDKSKTKANATNQIKYIWFFSDFNSPYYQQSESDRHSLILADVIKDKDFKVDTKVKEGIKKYQQINSSPAIDAIDAAYAFMRNIQDYFKTVKLTEVSNPKTVTDIFANMPKMVEALNQAKKAAYAEQSNGVKVRGGADVGLFEDM